MAAGMREPARISWSAFILVRNCDTLLPSAQAADSACRLTWTFQVRVLGTFDRVTSITAFAGCPTGPLAVQTAQQQPQTLVGSSTFSVEGLSIIMLSLLLSVRSLSMRTLASTSLPAMLRKRSSIPWSCFAETSLMLTLCQAAMCLRCFSSSAACTASPPPTPAPAADFWRDEERESPKLLRVVTRAGLSSAPPLAPAPVLEPEGKRLPPPAPPEADPLGVIALDEGTASPDEDDAASAAMEASQPPTWRRACSRETRRCAGAKSALLPTMWITRSLGSFARSSSHIDGMIQSDGRAIESKKKVRQDQDGRQNAKPCSSYRKSDEKKVNDDSRSRLWPCSMVWRHARSDRRDSTGSLEMWKEREGETRSVPVLRLDTAPTHRPTRP